MPRIWCLNRRRLTVGDCHLCTPAESGHFLVEHHSSGKVSHLEAVIVDLLQPSIIGELDTYLDSVFGIHRVDDQTALRPSLDGYHDGHSH